MHLWESDAASYNALACTKQATNNKKTLKVYMTAKLADGWIASDRIGTFPRVLNQGNKYIRVFYIHDPNFIKGIAIKSDTY